MIKVALVSTGLGNTARGFEISTARWFEALQAHTNLDVRLYSGGPYPGAKQLWNMPRHSLWTRPVHYVPLMSEKSRWEWTYGVEQFSFWSALNFELLDWKPDVIWIKDYPLGHFLNVSRVMFGLKFKLVFANGGMPDVAMYKDFDYIQQIQSRAYEEALSMGIPSDKMEMLSNCIPVMEQTESRADVRRSLGLSESDWVIVCVAAWNRYHKRIDYLLKEVADLNDPDVKLILCGTPEIETKALQDMGKELLDSRVQWLTVDSKSIPGILKASDVFVLPSLDEFLGNSLIEAAMYGLPIVTHPHASARFAINDEFWMTDLSVDGNLTERLQWLRDNQSTLTERLLKLKASLAGRFSEEILAARFERMVTQLIRNTEAVGPGETT